MKRVKVPFGKGELSFEMGHDWLGQVVHPEPVAPAPDPGALLRDALEDPIDSPRLADLASPGQQVAVIVDDYTRKSPMRLMLPPVLERLQAAGVREADVRLVVALGTHRPMTREEILTKVGTGVADRYEVVNVPSKDEDQMVYMGQSSNGIPAWVNRAVAEADVRIGLGMITPHMDTGFSGGAKIILPGVCSSRTVDAFHAASAFGEGNPLGDIEASLRMSLEAFVSERVPLHFVLNAVTTPAGELYRCVAGDPVRAHRQGGEYARAVFGARAERRYPVVVANAYPYDVDWWQSYKGIYCGDLLTEDGGVLIVLTAASEGNSTYPLVPRYAGRDPEELKDEMRRGAVEDPKQATGGVLLGRLKKRVNVVLVSEGLTSDDARTMGVSYYNRVETALEHAVKRLPASQRSGAVAVVPQAGLFLPILA